MSSLSMFVVQVEWQESEQRIFIVYCEGKDEAECMAEDKLVELGDLEVGELHGDDSEAEMFCIEVVGPPVPDEPELFWVM